MLLLCAALWHLTFGYSPTYPYINGYSYEPNQPQTAQVTYKYSWQPQVQRTYNWEPNGRTYNLSHTNNGQDQDHTYGLSQTAGSKDDTRTYKLSHTGDGDAVPYGLTQTDGSQNDIYRRSREAKSQEISPTLIPESEDKTNTPNDYVHDDDTTETTKIFTPKSETKNKTATSRPLRSTTPITKSGILTKLKRPFNVYHFEWNVGIYSKRYSPYMQICGGSVVKNDVVLSAAHCFWDDDVGPLQPSLFAVAGGSRLRTWDTFESSRQHSHIKDIKIPPRFQGSKTSFQDDIAVLLLNNSLVYAFGVKPICVSFDEDLDREQLSNGTFLTISGWGLTENWQPSPISGLLLLPYMEIEECIRTVDVSFLKYITSDKICAGDQKSGKAVCRGDSGSGLAYFSNYAPYLRGIASTAQRHDKEACNPHAVAIFTHVLAHRRFLVQHVPDIAKDCEELYDRGSENMTTSGHADVKKEENPEPSRNGSSTTSGHADVKKEENPEPSRNGSSTTSGHAEVKKEENPEPSRNGSLIQNTTSDKRNFTVLPQAAEDEQDRRPIWGFAD